MSSSATPFGLKPAFSPSGVVRQSVGTIATGYAANIFQFAPVKIVAAGGLEAAAAGDRFIGAFMGVEWTDSDGRRRVSNKWTASTAGTEIVAYYTSDPSIVYQIQGSGSIALADLGEQMDFTAQAGNTTTGLSTVALDITSSAANAGLRIVGLNPGPDNAWGDSYTIVEVQISEHQNVADVAAY